MRNFENIIDSIRRSAPLVHFITNYVTVNDCANITLAIGGSPIMADDFREVEEIIHLASSLVINIGTLNQQTIEAMLIAGRAANRKRIPVILDPAGAGSSKLRNETLITLMREIDFTVIKGNISEIKFLADGITNSQGVDANQDDLVTESNLMQSVEFTRKLSLIAGSVIAITSPIDIISSNTETYIVRNGHPLMTSVSGTGCMGGALMGSCIAVSPKEAITAATTAIAAMGICGELAYEHIEKIDGGIATYRTLIIDNISKMDTEIFKKHMKIEQI